MLAIDPNIDITSQDTDQNQSSDVQDQAFHIELYEEKETSRAETLFSDPSPSLHEKLSGLDKLISDSSLSTPLEERQKIARVRYMSRYLEEGLAQEKLRFKALKKQFISVSSADRLLERVFSGVGAEFVTEEDVLDAQRQRDQRKESVKEQRGHVDAALLEISDLAKIISQEHQNLEKNSNLVSQVNAELEKLEAALQAINPSDIQQPNPELLALEKYVSSEQKKLSDLEQTVLDLERLLSDNMEAEALIKEEVHALTNEKKDVSRQAEEAIRLAEAKDPRLDELAIWYKSMTSFLKQVNGVDEIVPGENCFNIRYTMDDATVYTMVVQFPARGKESERLSRNSSVSVNVVEASSLDFSDICAAYCSATSLSADILVPVIRFSYARLCKYHSREQELAIVMAPASKWKDAVMYDSSIRELLVYNEHTGRTFVFRLDINYPLDRCTASSVTDHTGGNGIVVVAVEPAQDEEEVLKWQNLINERVTRVTDMIHLLQ